MGHGFLLTAASNAIYMGTEQFITLIVVLSVLGAILVFLLKYQFKEITNGIKRTEDKLQVNNDKINESIDKLESKTDTEIASIKKEIGNIKGDFATSFVLREDFFRSMNGVEDNIRETSRKIDQILILMGDKK